jgi:hypothetical protein
MEGKRESLLNMRMLTSSKNVFDFWDKQNENEFNPSPTKKNF